MTSIQNQVRQFIVDNFILGGQRAAFQDGDSLMELHVIDSTGFLEIIAFLEETFRIQVEDEEMVPENLDSLDNIAAYVGRKLGAQASA